MHATQLLACAISGDNEVKEQTLVSGSDGHLSSGTEVDTFKLIAQVGCAADVIKHGTCRAPPSSLSEQQSQLSLVQEPW